ncbi:MAG TPA: zinc ribbon domain-containing protein [Armatimonadota bacterium]|nr:zinc ribbon domain-containing protein [Armatimonadota bacterium]HQK92937.1 zinc ribbon domain-containing protein [Armatimonadota bacterium]
MGLVEFVNNYEDLSTDKGFQFKFFCEHCGNGYMTQYKVSKLGVATGLLDAAGRLFGGALNRAADSGYEIQRSIGGPAHDAALREAVEEVKAHFKQCSRCGQWVCPEHCWNASRGMCERCAPDLAEEIAAAQQEAAIEQVREKVREIDYTKDLDLGTPASATCPHCGAKTGPGKFCTECGKPLAARTECPQCGQELKAGARFCSECGARIGG